MSVFLTFVTPNLLERIWDDGNNFNLWVYRNSATNVKKGVSYTESASRINGGRFSLRLLYKWLAILIRVIGTQKTPKENTKNKRQYWEKSDSASKLECS